MFFGNGETARLRRGARKKHEERKISVRRLYESLWNLYKYFRCLLGESLWNLSDVLVGFWVLILSEGFLSMSEEVGIGFQS